MIPAFQSFGVSLEKHGRIIWALLMRELATRYGRNDIGFLWVVVEPMIFAGGVSVLWSLIRPPYDSGIKVVAFVVTGYMPLILIRQGVNFSVNAVKANQALLYHRQITPLHLFVSRYLVEFLGITLALFIAIGLLTALGYMGPPVDILLVYEAWFLLAYVTFGLALIIGALSELFDVVERVVQIVTYIMIPLSGAFFVADALPPAYRAGVLVLPFIHCFELFRRGFFGPYVFHAYYNVPYALAWASGLTLVGLALVQYVRGRVEVE